MPAHDYDWEEKSAQFISITNLQVSKDYWLSVHTLCKTCMQHHNWGWDVAQSVRASDCYTTDTGSIPRLQQGIFFPESTFSADSLSMSDPPPPPRPACNHMH